MGAVVPGDDRCDAHSRAGLDRGAVPARILLICSVRKSLDRYSYTLNGRGSGSERMNEIQQLT
jgi:hypothetical protein